MYVVLIWYTYKLWKDFPHLINWQIPHLTYHLFYGEVGDSGETFRFDFLSKFQLHSTMLSTRVPRLHQILRPYSSCSRKFMTSLCFSTEFSVLPCPPAPGSQVLCAREKPAPLTPTYPIATATLLLHATLCGGPALASGLGPSHAQWASPACGAVLRPQHLREAQRRPPAAEPVWRPRTRGLSSSPGQRRVCTDLVLVLGDVGVDLMQGAHAVELA